MHDKVTNVIVQKLVYHIINQSNGGYNHAKSEKQRVEEKLKKIEERKKVSGSRKNKRLLRYSEKFNEIFTFFLMSYRSGLLTFCGSDVKVEFDLDSDDGKFGYRKFENGEVKLHNLKSCHPNVMRGVIIGKKSWGLWSEEWSSGVVECSFTKEEVFEEFYKRNIKIPEPFLLDFENTIIKKKNKRNSLELERLQKMGLL